MLTVKLRFLRAIARSCLLLLAIGTCHAQGPATNSAPELLDHLAGQWILQGNIAGQPTTHDIQAEWVLKREYLRIHEVSREKDAKGAPAYEAIVFIGRDSKTQEYRCLWLDATGGDGLSADAIGRGKKSGDSIAFLFSSGPSNLIHNTFVYDRAADTWKWIIDNETKGKTERFADVKLSRVH